MSSSRIARARQAFLATVCILAALQMGCAKQDADEGSSGKVTLLLYCGAGIRPPADELVDAFARAHGVKVVADYAGSEVLLSKIRVARRGDLYMPGDKHYVEQAAADGLVLSSRRVCHWVPTILVRKGNPKNIRGLEDLMRPGLRLGLGDPNVCAIGRTTYEVFAKNRITPADIRANLKYHSLTVNELGMQIQAKALDAVIVWDAMARYYDRHGDQVAIPPEDNVISSVDIGVLSFTKHRELAEKFTEFLTSERGRQIFAKHDYSTNVP